MKIIDKKLIRRKIVKKEKESIGNRWMMWLNKYYASVFRYLYI